MDIQPIFRCAVGMDVHLTTIAVCVMVAEPGCEPEVHRQPFGAFQRRNLRQLSRYHNRTTAMLAAAKNRLVRVLSDAGIRLTAVVSDPHGVAARAMIDGHLQFLGGKDHLSSILTPSVAFSHRPPSGL